MRRALVLVVTVTVIVGFSLRRAQGQASSTPLPQPTFHHIHLNSVDPDKSLAWYAQYWPKGKKTTFAGFPAFADDQGFYLLYSKASKQAPGAFEPERRAIRSAERVLDVRVDVSGAEPRRCSSGSASSIRRRSGS